MLADDNKYALLRFSKLVDWEQYGFQLAATAIDGNEAWEVYQEVHPEVVITDIQMPGLDGCELSSRIKQEDPGALILFLSSYNEFDYARAAIGLNVYDYILKQELDASMLGEKLEKIRAFLETRDRTRLGQIAACFHASAGKFAADYSRVLSGNWGFLAVCQDHLPTELTELFSFAETGVVSDLPEKLMKQVSGLNYAVQGENFCWFCLYQNHISLKTLLEEIRRTLSEFKENTFSVIVFGNDHTLSYWRNCCERDRHLFACPFFDGGNQIFYADFYEEKKQIKAIELGELRRAIKRWDTGEIQYELNQIYLQILRSRDIDVFAHTLSKIRALLYEESTDALSDEIDWKAAENEEPLTARDVIFWFQRRITQFIKLRQRENAFQSKILARAVRCMEQEYADTCLSVETVARKAGVSVNRLNELFKIEQNTTAGKYLTKIRMEKAKAMLDCGITDLGEVSRMAGYNSGSYFSKVFRKYYGMSPSEYRREEL